jgi:exosortase A
MSVGANAIGVPSVGGRLIRSPWLPVAIAWLALVLLFWHTFVDMWRVWGASGTYTHGYAIFPIALALLWYRREQWVSLPLRPSIAGIVVVVASLLLWWVGSLLHLNVLMQLGVVSALVTSVLAIAGPEVFRAAAFPLLFMFFAVPIGEELVPLLMDFTARFTVGALDLVGIPVLAEGHLIYIPTGTFSVEKACSGIRYLFASIVLGTLYANLFYHTTWRRVLFVALCVVVPVIANGARAFLIVILAHLSRNEIAIGIDHLIYGWVFFGIVMLLVFWMGRLIAEPAAISEAAPLQSSAVRDGGGLSPWLALSVLLVLLAGLRIAAAALPHDENGATVHRVAARVPAPLEGWTGPLTISSDWAPRFIGTPQVVTAAYLHGANAVDVALLSYERERPGAELINSENLLFDPEPWTWLGEGSLVVSLADGERIPVFAVQIRRGLEHRAIWRVLVVGDRAVGGGMQAKLERAKAILRGSSGAGTALVVSAELSGEHADPEPEVRAFVVSYYSQLLGCLRNTTASAGCVPAP